MLTIERPKVYNAEHDRKGYQNRVGTAHLQGQVRRERRAVASAHDLYPPPSI